MTNARMRRDSRTKPPVPVDSRKYIEFTSVSAYRQATRGAAWLLFAHVMDSGVQAALTNGMVQHLQEEEGAESAAGKLRYGEVLMLPEHAGGRA
jgi:hypothetical protein